MKILVISDDDGIGGIRLPDERYDLILTCGDVLQYTINEIQRNAEIPAYGVAGNHDNYELPDRMNLHLKIKEYRGYKFGGFEGSWKYKPIGYHLYSDQAVQVKLKDFLYVDVFLAHNPPKGIHDMADDVHNGFSAFYEYIQRQKPMYFIHGHVHKNQESQVGETKVISVYGCRFLELPDK